MTGRPGLDVLRVTAVIGVVIIHAMRPLSTNRTIEDGRPPPSWI